ncbi:MAG: hypothetical protein KHX55_02300 [Proteobacteria bacterium]|nr:hypothetical protein [Pseudomonadota bacterium]
MRKKYGLTRHERALLNKAHYYQYKAEEMHRKFADSLQNRFYNSATISDFEEWDLWTLNESGDCSGTEQEERFWRKVRDEEEKEK